MPPTHRLRRSSTDHEAFEEDDFQNAEPSKKGGDDKLKLFILKLAGRWYCIVLGLILGYFGANYYVSKLPRLYQSTTTLLIKQNTGSLVGGDVVEEINSATTEGMNTVAARIARLDLLENVASRQDVRALTNLTPPAVDWRPDFYIKRFGDPSESARSSAPPPPGTLGSMIAGWLTITIQRGTRLMDITVTHPVPEVAKTIADAIAREYLAEITANKSEIRTSSTDLLQKESDDAKKTLQQARTATGIYARALEIHRNLQAMEETVSMMSKYTDLHPKKIAAMAEVKRLQNLFIVEFEVARNAPAEKSVWDEVMKSLPDYQSDPALFLRLARQQLLARTGTLQSDIDTSQGILSEMINKTKRSLIERNENEISASVSSLARVSGWPVSPQPSKIIGTGVLGGVAGGVLIALLLMRLDNKFHTVAQIASETGETVLAAVADIKTNHLAYAEKSYWKKNAKDATPEEKAAFSAWDPRLVFKPGTSTTNYAEMYRILRASVSLLGDETRRKITLFSSALPGEGKTSTSTNFALAAAAQGRKTLLIDLDLRKPSIHKFFGLTRVQEKGGITECLANQANFEDIIIREPSQENLHIIVSGARAPNPGELLDTGRLKSILAQACREFDVVVLDTAPLLAVPDTRIVAPLADNICLVVRAEYTPKGAVHRVLKILDEDGSSISGIVFNGFQEKRRLIGENYSYGYYKTSRYGRAYRYGYGAYGAYGSDDEG